jgi:predicted Zn-dependent protease
MKKGDTDGALTELKRAVELKPDNSDARKAYAEALNGKGEREAAIAQLDEALKQKPDDASLKELRSSYESAAK